MKPKQQITFPDGGDRNLLSRIAKLASEERERRFNRNRDALAQQIKAFPKPAKLDKDAARAAAESLRQLRLLHSRSKPPKFVPLKGHNPAQYAPFAFAEGFLHCGGGIGPQETCGLYGPDAATGEFGANMARDLERHPSDFSSALSTVGFWYLSQASGTLSVMAQTFLTGHALVVDGYSDSRLELAVETVPLQNTGARRSARTLADSSHPTIYRSTKDLFRVGAVAGELPFDQSKTIIPFLWEDFLDWEGRTISVLAPVMPYNWYLITVTAYQFIAYGGTSDFHIYAGPVASTLV